MNVQVETQNQETGSRLNETQRTWTGAHNTGSETSSGDGTASKASRSTKHPVSSEVGACLGPSFHCGRSTEKRSGTRLACRTHASPEGAKF